MLAEAALETVPDKISRHPSVRTHAERLGVRPAETLLDRSYHHAAMKAMDGAPKRGRPDIVHFALMEALSTPLYMNGLLEVYVHTAADKVITIETEQLRVPKSFFRFEGLMIDLFRSKAIKSPDGAPLLRLEDMTLAKLLKSFDAGKVIGLSTAGVMSTAERVAQYAPTGDDDDEDNCTFVVGGFPRGHFSERTTGLFNFTYSISNFGLEAHVVIARIIYECEKRVLSADETEPISDSDGEQ